MKITQKQYLLPEGVLSGCRCVMLRNVSVGYGKILRAFETNHFAGELTAGLSRDRVANTHQRHGFQLIASVAFARSATAQAVQQMLLRGEDAVAFVSGCRRSEG